MNGVQILHDLSKQVRVVYKERTIDGDNMEYQQIIESMQNLSGAHIWLVMAVLVFAVCAVLTFITFQQFTRHQDNFKSHSSQEEPGAVLIDTSNSTSIAKYKISEKPAMIGRIEASDSDIYDSIVVPESTVGRRHAVIEYEKEAFWIQDQGSVNGSYVNGQRIEEKHRLRDGDYIKIHKYTFQFLEKFANGMSRSENEFEALAQISQVLPLTQPGLSMRTNDVLPERGYQNETMLEMPRHEKQVETEQQRTQVLYKNEMEPEITQIKRDNRDLSDQEIRKNIQDMTVQLFMSPNDDKTERLYSELLDAPPVNQPDYSKERASSLSRLKLSPDIGEQVQKALGEFFEDPLDDMFSSSRLELTEKGDKLTQMGHFSTHSPISNSVYEKSRKE